MATAVLSLPKQSKTADRLRSGAGVAAPNTFMDLTLGTVSVDRRLLNWSAPVLVAETDSAHMRVRLTGTVLDRASSVAARQREISGFSVIPGTLAVHSRKSSIETLSNSLSQVNADTHTLSAHLPSPAHSWSIALSAAELPVARSFGSRRDLPNWLDWMVPLLHTIRPALHSTVAVLIAALPWLVLVLAGVYGGLDSLSASDSGQRFLAIAGIAVSAHVVVAIVPVLVAADYFLEYSYSDLHAFATWPVVGLVSVGGSVILLAALSALVPVAVRRANSTDAPVPHVLRNGLLVLLASVASTAYAVVLEQLDGAGSASNVERIILVYSGITIVLVVIAALAGLVLRLLARPAQPRIPSLQPAVALALPIATASTLVYDGGLVPWFVRWAPLLIAGGMAVLALLRAAGSGNLGRWNSLLLWAVAVATLCIPWHRPALLSVNLDVLPTLLQGVDGLVALVLVVAALQALRALGTKSATAETELASNRFLGMAVSFIVFTRDYSFYRLISLWSLLAAGLGAVLLFPRSQPRQAWAVLRQTEEELRKAVATVTTAGAARRQLPTTRKALRDQTAAADLPLQVQQSRIRDLERQAGRDQEPFDSDAAVPRQCALGALGPASPWRQGQVGALAGTLLGLPWTAVNLIGTTVLRTDVMFPLPSTVTGIAVAALQWTGYGFVFGYFFPLLSGKTGLAKAVRLGLAALAPTVLEAVLVPHHTSRLTSTLIAMVQMAAFAMSLGLWADRRSLTRHGYHWSRLVDVHNLGSLTAWASSVAAALATGLATLILAGVQPFIAQVVHPPAAPATPTAIPTAPTTTASKGTSSPSP